VQLETCTVEMPTPFTALHWYFGIVAYL